MNAHLTRTLYIFGNIIEGSIAKIPMLTMMNSTALPIDAQ